MGDAVADFGDFEREGGEREVLEGGGEAGGGDYIVETHGGRAVREGSKAGSGGWVLFALGVDKVLQTLLTTLEI
jgi:hypothetical protein